MKVNIKLSKTPKPLVLLLTGLMCLAFLPAAYGQAIVVQAEDQLLSDVLISLRDKYNVQMSFNHGRLSQYRVDINDRFSGVEPAIRAVLEDQPVSYRKSGQVYLIYEDTKKKFSKPETSKEEERLLYRFRGRIVDCSTGEALPFSSVQIETYGMMTDAEGFFSYTAYRKEKLEMRASHLGYLIADTSIYPNHFYEIALQPATAEMEEVLIEANVVEYGVQTGSAPGTIKLNHRVADFLAGSGDNSVFNLLRLQPGILAAGEQSNDLIIRGSYEGMSAVKFDGFTILGLKNFNDNISAVNPYMAKEITVLKSGYGPEYGGRAGGIVNITGSEGRSDKTELKLNLNTNTLNGYFSLPVGDQSALSVAYRQTYYNLFDSLTLDDVLQLRRESSAVSDLQAFPDYHFRDFNLKYAGETRPGDRYYISFYRGTDNFISALEYNGPFLKIVRETGESNKQNGGAAAWNHIWANGNTSKFTAFFSDLNSRFTDDVNVSRKFLQTVIHHRDYDDANRLQAFGFQSDSRFIKHSELPLSLGFGITGHRALVQEDSFKLNLLTDDLHETIANGYVKQELQLGDYLNLKLGVRADYPFKINKLYLQPRLEMQIRLSKSLNVNSAYGHYDQFVIQSVVADERGNYRYLWTLADNEELFPVRARHWVGGLSYTQNGFTFSTEAFRNEINNLARYLNYRDAEFIYRGNALSKGVDVFVKQEYKGHSAWISYTFSYSDEHFDYMDEGVYRRALQDQRHEVKAAALFSFNPFYLSANYVWGSGFPDPTPLRNDGLYEQAYSRLDGSIMYRLIRPKVRAEFGFSVLNVLNTENIKYDNFYRVPRNQTASIDIYAEAVPFTPTLFFNLMF